MIENYSKEQNWSQFELFSSNAHNLKNVKSASKSALIEEIIKIMWNDHFETVTCQICAIISGLSKHEINHVIMRKSYLSILIWNYIKYMDVSFSNKTSIILLLFYNFPHLVTWSIAFSLIRASSLYNVISL